MANEENSDVHSEGCEGCARCKFNVPPEDKWVVAQGVLGMNAVRGDDSGEMDSRVLLVFNGQVGDDEGSIAVLLDQLMMNDIVEELGRAMRSIVKGEDAQEYQRMRARNN